MFVVHTGYDMTGVWEPGYSEAPAVYDYKLSVDNMNGVATPRPPSRQKSELPQPPLWPRDTTVGAGVRHPRADEGPGRSPERGRLISPSRSCVTVCSALLLFAVEFTPGGFHSSCSPGSYQTEEVDEEGCGDEDCVLYPVPDSWVLVVDGPVALRTCCCCGS